ncbi:MAG TPA: PilZ domain-containing protein [Terriglobales bacterium]|nr:PilZ domain-containing protein [Terriglobales bacterium]
MSDQAPSDKVKRTTQPLEDQAWAEIAQASRDATGVKQKPRVAITNLEEPAISLLQAAFNQYGIDTVVINSEDGQFLRDQKFEGCALKLSSSAATILETARSSELNRHMVVYGISSNAVMILRLLKYGINAILDHPINEKTLDEVIKATHTVVKGEIRRFIRVPLFTLISVKVEGDVTTAQSRQISATGMAMVPNKPLAKGQKVTLSFTLPNTQFVNTDAIVCWLSEREKMVGVRFDPPENCIELIRPWIEENLALS